MCLVDWWLVRVFLPRISWEKINIFWIFSTQSIVLCNLMLSSDIKSKVSSWNFAVKIKTAWKSVSFCLYYINNYIHSQKNLYQTCEITRIVWFLYSVLRKSLLPCCCWLAVRGGHLVWANGSCSPNLNHDVCPTQTDKCFFFFFFNLWWWHETLMSSQAAVFCSI